VQSDIHNARRVRERFNLWETDAFRVFDGDGDGYPGLTIDAYAGRWLVSTTGIADEEDLPRGLQAAIQSTEGVHSYWWKRLDQHDKEPPILIWARAGKSSKPTGLISEHGISYEIDLLAGYSQGIFLDQRLNRLKVREASSRGMKVLNLFSYTCAFSVTAAIGGATTTSLDLSQPYLDWGKKNMEANGLSPDDHYWCKGDAFEWLARFKKSGRTFDAIIIDPPTFSRSGKGKNRRTFQAETDYPELVAAAAAVLEDGGWMLATTNCRRLNTRGFRRLVERGLADSPHAGRDLMMEPMPPEYTGEFYLKSCWLD